MENTTGSGEIIKYDTIVKVEKTPKAKDLEEKLNISWDLKQAHEYDAGFDLRACLPEQGVNLVPGRRELISAGIHIELQPGWEAQIRPRSGIALKKGLTVLNSPGTIDYEYRGEVGVLVHNTGRESVYIPPGERIAQIVFKRVPRVDVQMVEEINRDTIRGSGGFGSTGTK